MTVSVNTTIAGGGSGGGGGGSSTFAGLTDAITATIPTTNTPLSNALTLKAALAAINVFTKNQSVTPVVLTDAATIATDASLSNNFYLTMLTNARVMGAPTNPTGSMVCNWVVNSGAGAFTMMWAAAFDFGDAGAPTHSVAANKEDLVSAIYSSVTSKWLCSFRKGS